MQFLAIFFFALWAWLPLHPSGKSWIRPWLSQFENYHQEFLVLKTVTSSVLSLFSFFFASEKGQKDGVVFFLQEGGDIGNKGHQPDASPPDHTASLDNK